MNQHLRVISFFGLALLVASACTRKAAEENSSFSITLPKLHSKTVSKSWGSTMPDTIADVNCYVVMIEGPEPIMQDNVCKNSWGAVIARPGIAFGGYAPGSTIEVTVAPGNRTIYIVGVEAANSLACSTFRTNTNTSQYSAAAILAKTTRQLVPGKNEITLTASLNGAQQMDNCTGPDFPGNTTPSWISSFSVAAEPLAEPEGMEFSFTTKDSNGNIYISTTTNNGGDRQWTITRSINDGSTWATVDTHTADTSYGWGIAGDSLGNVYAVGAIGPSLMAATTAVIRKFNGSTWSDVFSYQMEAGQISEFNRVAVDSSNNIYVVGKAHDTTPIATTKVVVFKSTNQGSTWALVDTFTHYESEFPNPTRVLTKGSNDVYIAGHSLAVFTGAVPGSWVRKSSDGGVTWRTIYEDWDGGYIRDMVLWNNGIAFIKDYDRGPYNGRIKVFATADDFQHLTALYSYAPPNPLATTAGFLGVDSRGYLYAAGTAADTSYNSYEFVAAYRNGSWTKLIDKKFSGDESESPDAFFFNNQNQVFYVAPYTADGGTTNSLRVNRATITVPTTFTLGAIGNGNALISPIPSGSKIIYVTSALVDGNLGASPSAAITQADALCNSDSHKPFYASGSFKAAIVASGARIACTTANCGGGAAEHIDWPLAANQSYVTRSGLEFGTTTASGLFTAIDPDNILAMYNPVPAWNGLRQDGAYYWMFDSSQACLDWSSNSNSEFGWAWDPTYTTWADFYSPSGNSLGNCDELRPLICVEQ